MLLKNIQLKNFLSYGASPVSLDLKELNILIGANGSGKSNLFEALALIKSTPQELVRPIRLGGSVRDWLWKGGPLNDIPEASIEVIVDTKSEKHMHQPLRYRFNFTDTSNRFDIVDELLEYEKPNKGETRPYFFYKYEHGNPILNIYNGNRYASRQLKREDVNPEKSILSQRYDPHSYPEISYLADAFKSIKIYRDWSFGIHNVIRQQQRLDMQNGPLTEDMSNAALVLSRIKKNIISKNKFIEYCKSIYNEVEDVELDLNGGAASFYIREGNFNIPATRLSDGSLRFIFLLLILCDPEPPKFICIDEPELGLHPDMINTLKNVLVDASTRTQVVVSTHSADLVSAFTENPEYIVVCDKDKDGTRLHRLSSSELEKWLEDYELGTLWMRGAIGGTRW